MLLDCIPVAQLYGQNRLYVDYLAGRANGLFSHPVDALAPALRARQGWHSPRADVAHTLRSYLRSLDAPAASLQAVEKLGGDGCMCVTTGQQVGLLGGPVYSLYKALSAIRLARQIERDLQVPCVALFWLASEDHDFAEINHAHLQLASGDTRRVHFPWAGEGRSISDLPWTSEVAAAVADFWQLFTGAPNRDDARTLFAPSEGGGAASDRPGAFVEVFARALLQLLGDQGLLVTEPRLLRPLAVPFQAAALADAGDVRVALRAAEERVRARGYPPALDVERAGTMFRYHAGLRVRMTADECVEAVRTPPEPEELSTDAVLRPVFADWVLPTVATILGPGEVAYHAMLAPVYEVFGVPQPLVVGRQGCTVLPGDAGEVLERYGLGVADLLRPGFRAKRAALAAADADQRAPFAAAAASASAALAPLRDLAAAADPGLARTWERSVARVVAAVTRLEERTLRAQLSGGTTGERRLRQLANVAFPRRGLQERVLPIAHFVATYGREFVAKVAAAFEETNPGSHGVLAIPSAGEAA